MIRVQSANELLVIDKIGLIEYYNTIIVPLAKKFTPMAEGKTEGICPFHQDTDPSLHVWKKKGIYHCFGCGYGGDIVKTHKQIMKTYKGENLSIDMVIKQLANIFDITLNEEVGYTTESVFERARKMVGDQDSYKIPKGTMTFSEFRRLNNRIIKANMNAESKVHNFAQLDIITSIALSNK